MNQDKDKAFPKIQNLNGQLVYQQFSMYDVIDKIFPRVSANLQQEICDLFLDNSRLYLRSPPLETQILYDVCGYAGYNHKDFSFFSWSGPLYHGNVFFPHYQDTENMNAGVNNNSNIHFDFTSLVDGLGNFNHGLKSLYNFLINDFVIQELPIFQDKILTLLNEANHAQLYYIKKINLLIKHRLWFSLLPSKTKQQKELYFNQCIDNLLEKTYNTNNLKLLKNNEALLKYLLEVSAKFWAQGIDNFGNSKISILFNDKNDIIFRT